MAQLMGGAEVVVFCPTLPNVCHDHSFVGFVKFRNLMAGAKCCIEAFTAIVLEPIFGRQLLAELSQWLSDFALRAALHQSTSTQLNPAAMLAVC